MTQVGPRATGPSFWELARQALSSTKGGYDLLAPKFEATPYATPIEWIESALLRAEECYPISNTQTSTGADLACGTGRGARALRAYTQRVEGFDFSPGMLTQARALSLEFEGLDWIVADLSDFQLPPQKYDRIVSFGAWGHILPSFRASFLGQIFESLRPGGVFLTLTSDDPKIWQKRFWHHLLFDLAILLRNLFWFHEFHMYYRLNSTERLEKELQRHPLMDERFELRSEALPGFEETSITLLTLYRKPGG